MWSRRIELVCGALGGGLGLAALGVWLFAPLCPIGGPLRCQGLSLLQYQGLASLLSPITLFGGLSLGIAVFALWHGLARTPLALVLLRLCAALLGVAWVATLMALPTFGVLIASPIIGVPPVLALVLTLAPVLALVASIAGTVAARQRVPAHG